MKIKIFGKLLHRAAVAWYEDNTLTLGAALAYYTVFSISPLLIITLAIMGYFYEGESAGYFQAEMSKLVGQTAAGVITGLLNSLNQSKDGTSATVVSVIMLFIGASSVFVQLQGSLNRIWGVTPRPGHYVRDFLTQRLASFAMIVGAGFLLLFSLFLSAALATITGYFGYLLPSAYFIWHSLDVALSFAVVVLIFAAIYKVVPDVRIDWKDVWVGALLTAILFVLGKSLISFYLGRRSVGSAFGAAGSVLVILAWVYYSSQILFFGAEFTKIYSEQYRQTIKPVEGAETVTEEAEARERGDIEHIPESTPPQTAA